jgi:hypothetical protein
MQIIFSAETWTERREAERAARWFNQFAQPTEYAMVDGPGGSEPCYRLRVISFQPRDYIRE